MFKSRITKSIIDVAIVAILATLSFVANAQGTYHNDHRTTAKIDINPVYQNNTKLVEDALALDFLFSNKQRYGLDNIFNTLQLSKVKSSLLGKHYHFQQFLNDVEVDKAEIIVSINKNKRITRVFNNTFPVVKNINKTSKNLIGNNLAEEKVWDFLQVSGKLRVVPKSKLIYLNIGSKFKLSYKINMTVTHPFGDWEFYLDAESGDVINARRIDLPISKNANSESHFGKWKAFDRNKNQIKYQDILSAFHLENNKNGQNQYNKADATALVFDPDPVTTLNNDSLEDTSPATDFDAAYFTRTLSDVTLSNGTYSLVGPWVTITDFESPTTAPSTTTDGNWTAKRGDNAFNDAMTYFHIDQNQRYMQSLGFVDATGIQFVSISVDTDAVNGDDNSYFSPGANQLAFGHGCVDDNEDVDVILHEYGHAINTSINSNFSGGDTGAIGEGFGDYWAASYSYSTPNGRTVHPEWAFSWDGHNACWNGRLLNQTSFRYDSTQTYPAHTPINGQNGDELWSTPITETLIELMDDGVPREEVDQIILEAQFGLGSGIKMPDMAASIVSTAVELFPSGSHSAVFDSNFKMMEILGESLAIDQVTVVSSGDNTVIDPGETVSLNISLENTGGVSLTAVSSTLSSSTNGVTVDNAVGSYADISAGASQTNASPYQFTLPDDQACGTEIALSLATNYNDGTAQNSILEFVLQVGLGNDLTQTSSPNLSIPDNNSVGVTDELTVSGAIANSTISVDMNITHTWRGDLTLTLTSPTGTDVILQSASNDSTSNIIGVYPTTLVTTGDLSVFDNEDHNGTWTLKVADGVALDIGTLNSWGIISTSPAVCNGNNPPTATVVSETLTVSEGDNVELDASPSDDLDGDALTFNWVQTSGSTMTLTNASSAIASFVATVIGEFNFEVTVTDPGGATDTQIVNVTVNGQNQAPTAVIVVNTMSIRSGESVSLNGSTSSDPDGEPLTFNWTQTSGPGVTINNSTSAISSFTAPQVSTATQLTFRLTVTDPLGESSSVDENITVNPIPEVVDGGGGGGGGGSLSLITLLGLFLIRKIKLIR